MSDSSAKKISVAAIGVAIVTSVASGLVIAEVRKTRTSHDKLTAIIPMFEQLQRRMDRAEEWQKDWERNGQLPADVEQTKDIGHLKEIIQRVDRNVFDIRSRVRALEMQGAKNARYNGKGGGA